MTKLTKRECATLDAAMEIFKKHTAFRASWMLGPAYYDHGENSKFTVGGVTYFDSAGFQHSHISGGSFSERVQSALDIEDAVEKDEAVIRQRKIDRLKRELSELGA